MNGRANCILQVCCTAPRSRAALAEQMVEDLGATEHEAKKYADWILDTFDLAPVGTLGAFKDAVAKLAREHP